ncbi:MAG: hypothetical protein K8T89_11235 [Planctomycetes bacterium]|nr:hypothetical protein [Planctomycetota bacterium]
MVFAVPRPGGGVYLLLYLASNRFGEAFGLTAGWNSDTVLPANLRPHPRQSHVYTGSEFVACGRWRHVGDRPDLLAGYPAEPEIYHHKADNPDDPAIGPFGAAETAGERLRTLSEAEFRASPLARADYRQIMLEEQVEEALRRWEGETRS